MEPRVTIRSAGGRLLAVKTANDAATSAELGLEAELLRRSAHPGVVTVVSFTSAGDHAELTLGAPSEHTVAEQMCASVTPRILPLDRSRPIR